MSDQIKEKGRTDEAGLNTLLERSKNDDKLMLCIYTTKFACTGLKPVDDTAHLLEVRAFDKQGEFRALRGNIGRDFVWRYISDEGIDESCTYDEIQCLDVDSQKTVGTEYVSIGGGHYEMPAEDYDRVVIRHYGTCDDNGVFALKDFRIVKLLKKGELYSG